MIETAYKAETSRVAECINLEDVYTTKLQSCNPVEQQVLGLGRKVSIVKCYSQKQDISLLSGYPPSPQASNLGKTTHTKANVV